MSFSGLFSIRTHLLSNIDLTSSYISFIKVPTQNHNQQKNSVFTYTNNNRFSNSVDGDERIMEMETGKV